ncbi:MAG: hypothetical protein EZS28_046499, partial [Streblomastix strix]
SRRSGNETAATVQTATGNTDIDRKHDASADGHDRAREPTEETIVTSNTSRIQQLNAEVVTSTTPERRSTSSVYRHATNENCRLYRRTGLGTEKADCVTSHRHEQEQAGDNATRMGSGSSEKTDTRNPTDCLFTTTASITTVELESIHTTEPILQLTPAIVDIWIATTTIPLSILQAANSIPGVTSSVHNYPTTKPLFTNDEPPQTQRNEPRPANSQIVREQQDPIQPGQQMEQATTQTVERPRQSTTSIRSVHNLLIPPIPAYPQQQIPRIPLLPYTTERNQEQRQSQRSISPTHKKADESEDDEFLDAIIPGMIMPHLPPHMNDIESAQ